MDQIQITFYLVLTIACALVTILYGILVRKIILRLDAGTAKMQEIASYIQDGAKAYMNRQYSTIGIVAIILFTILLVVYGLSSGWTYGALIAIGFLIGASFSALTGYIGMFVSVKANVRTAEAARKGLAPALDVAFKGGTVTGLLVVGLGLLGVAGYYMITKSFYPNDIQQAVKPLISIRLKLNQRFCKIRRWYFHKSC